MLQELSRDNFVDIEPSETDKDVLVGGEFFDLRVESERLLISSETCFFESSLFALASSFRFEDNEDDKDDEDDEETLEDSSGFWLVWDESAKDDPEDLHSS